MIEGQECSVEDLAGIHGVLEDAIRVSYDIANLLQKKERVKMFDEATEDPSKLDRTLLADILERKLRSDQI